jgi:hypothetical protein
MSEILSLDIKDKHSAVPETRRVGEAGEKLAARFLMKTVIVSCWQISKFRSAETVAPRLFRARLI